MKSDGLSGGEHSETIKITTNDPYNRVKEISVRLTVLGAPNLVTPDTIQFPTVYIGFPDTVDVVLGNNGTDVLSITNITVSDPQLTVIGSTAFTIGQKGTQRIRVAFNPITTGTVTTQFNITSNDPDASTAVVPIKAFSAQPPVVSVSPDSLTFVVNERDSTSGTLTISNTGAGTLQWNTPLNAQPSTPGKLKVLLWTKYTDSLNAGTVPNGVIHIFASEFGSLENIIKSLRMSISDVTIDTTKTTSPIEFASHLAQADVFIMPPQTYYDINEFAMLGASFASILTSFVQSGRTMIVLDAGFLYHGYVFTSTSFLNATGLLTINPTNNIPNESSARFGVVSDSTDGLVSGLLDTIEILNMNAQHISPDGKKIICDESSGNNIVTARYVGSGRVVYIGMDFSTYNYDMVQLLSNAVNASQATRFYSIQPNAGTVVPGSSVVATVKIYAQDVASVWHRAAIEIWNNDPLQNLKSVPVSLRVIGKPRIAVVPNSVSEVTYLGVSHVDTLQLKNRGSEVLQASSVTVSDTSFHLNKTSFSIQAGGQDNLLISFTPKALGTFAAGITIASNDSSHLLVTVPLSGTVVQPPRISVSRDSLFVSTSEGDSTTSKLTISNTGLGTLYWQSPQEALLPSSGKKRVLLWNKYSGYNWIMSNGFEMDHTKEAIGKYLSNIAFDSTVTTSPTELALCLAQTDVFILLSQESTSDLFGIGKTLSAPLTAFVQSGHTIIVLDAYSNGSTSFLMATGLLVIDVLSAPQMQPYPTLIANVSDSTSPLVIGVPSSFRAEQCSNYHTSSNGRKIIAEKYTGNNIVTMRDVGAGRVIYIGMNFNIYNDDMARVLANAVSSSYSNKAISLQPSSGTIASGGTQEVTVNVSAKWLKKGNYSSAVSFVSNDPHDITKVIPLTVNIGPSTSVEEETVIPKVFALYQNYPNPFNPSTTIKYDIPKAGHVSLEVYNILGQQVLTLMDEMQQAGSYSVLWDGRTRNGATATGVYFLRIRAGDYAKTIKTLMLK
jgi:hypothetical protein